MDSCQIHPKGLFFWRVVHAGQGKIPSVIKDNLAQNSVLEERGVGGELDRFPYTTLSFPGFSFSPARLPLLWAEETTILFHMKWERYRCTTNFIRLWAIHIVKFAPCGGHSTGLVRTATSEPLAEFGAKRAVWRGSLSDTRKARLLTQSRYLLLLLN